MKTYEESNWSKLSPRFREAHNRRRVAKGLVPIPPPLKDEYVEPPPQKVQPLVLSEADAMAEYRAQTGAFDAMLRARGANGGEGFIVKNPGNVGGQSEIVKAAQRSTASEGFSIRR